MTTLTLKKNNTEELLKTIQSQNELIIQLLEENNRLIKEKNNTNRTNRMSKGDIVDKIFAEFAPGNNHPPLMKLIKFVAKWDSADIAKIRERLVSIGLTSKHIKTFDRMIANDK